jgi:hypothetical protein
MRALAVALLLAVGAAGAMAQNEADPAAFVRAIYRDYAGQSPMPWFDRPYSTHLRKLVDAERRDTPKGEIGRLDFDPFVNGEDWRIGGLTVALVSRAADKATIEACFRNFTNDEDLRYFLVREGGAWRIDDLQSLKSARWTLSKILTGAPDAFPDQPAN